MADPFLALLAAEQLLVVRYDAALAMHPELAGRLSPLRADHAAHLSALRRASRAPPARLSASPRPTANPSAKPVAATVPATLAALASAERTAVAAFGAACLTAPAARAMLLGSIAACESSHLVALA